MTTPADRPAAPLHRPVVLLGEDLSLVRRPLKLLLERRGFDVIEAQDGGEVLALVGGPARVDCVLLDLCMPVVDGLEVLRALLRRRDAPPVIVHTSTQGPDAHRAIALGASAVVVKGVVSHRDLIERVARAVAASRRAGEHGACAASAPLGAGPAAAASGDPFASDDDRTPVPGIAEGGEPGSQRLEPVGSAIDPEVWLARLHGSAARGGPAGEPRPLRRGA